MTPMHLTSSQGSSSRSFLIGLLAVSIALLQSEGNAQQSESRLQKRHEVASIKAETWIFAGLAVAGIGMSFVFQDQARTAASTAAGTGSFGTYTAETGDAGFYTGLKDGSRLLGIAAAGAAAYFYFMPSSDLEEPSVPLETFRTLERDLDTLKSTNNRLAEELAVARLTPHNEDSTLLYSRASTAPFTTIPFIDDLFTDGSLGDRDEQQLQDALTLLQAEDDQKYVWEIRYKSQTGRHRAERILSYLHAFAPRLTFRIASQPTTQQYPYELRAFERESVQE